ncbi:alpha/beta hydrolase [Bacillus shivajii]|uniref:alpha/beta hydrolase n=1 Tax=Bacillus shivajii TaxID=1983719 RepID=UPI001CFAC63B|nr:alpha/beta fold hydrolase [Bacillus shivajii]UCZ51553.1 alpha/beta hydrolase [Bacillus shivajii]
MNTDRKYQWVEEMERSTFNLYEKNPHFHYECLQSYLAFYHFSVQFIDEYRCGTIKVNGKKQFLQLFLKENPKDTVFFVHGYLDHSGGLSRTVNHLLEENYQVVMLDLPGHGFSEGEEGRISNFENYVLAVENGYEYIKETLKIDEVAGLGHSTGAAILFHASTERKVNLSRLILVAPLYLPYRWNVFKGFLLLLGKFVSKKKRSFKKNSDDFFYQNFIKNDPLQVKILQADWLVALEKWQGEIVNCPKGRMPTYLLQGTKDTTVEWKRNITFYQEKCDDFQAVLFEGGRHQLLNERIEIRHHVHQRISSFLTEGQSDVLRDK